MRGRRRLRGRRWWMRWRRWWLRGWLRRRRWRARRMTNSQIPALGLGIGWRAEIALLIERRHDLGFVELLAEDFDPRGPLPAPVEQLRQRGVAVVPHGVSLSLGGAEPLDRARLSALARLAERVEAPLVSEHIA